MNQRRVKKRRMQKPKPLAHGEQYPGAHGKVVDWVEHKIRGGHPLYRYSIRGQDGTLLEHRLSDRDQRSQSGRLENWRLETPKTFRAEQKRRQVMVWRTTSRAAIHLSTALQRISLATIA